MKTGIFHSIKRAFGCILLLGLSFAAYASPELLDGQEYYKRLLADIRKSQSEIVVAMYLIALPSDAGVEHPVRKILDALILAKKRGVKVSIILDASGGTTREETPEGKNREAAMYLKQGSVEIQWDRPDVSLHSKMVVVDRRIVYVGSCNWSEYAFRRNTEHTLREEDGELAAKVMEAIGGLGDKGAPPAEAGVRFALPGSWIARGSPFLKLFTDDAPRLFDMLLLLYCYREQKPGYDFISGKLGLEGDNTARRRVINRCLEDLSERGFITCQTRFGKELEFECLAKPDGEGFFSLPEGYFNYGWNSRLSFKAKVALLILIKELEGRTAMQSWLNETGAKYGLSNEVQSGRQELREWGIISVEPSPMKDGKHDGPSLIRYLGLFDYGKREEEIRKIEEKYPAEEARIARERAAILYEKFNPARIEDLVMLGRRYGEKAMEEAFREVYAFMPDNPARNIRYVVGILKIK